MKLRLTPSSSTESGIGLSLAKKLMTLVFIKYLSNTTSDILEAGSEEGDCPKKIGRKKNQTSRLSSSDE